MERTDRKQKISADEFISWALRTFLENNLSFAMWRLPDTNIIHLAASEQVHLWSNVNLEAPPPGFLFSPFDPSQAKLFLPADEFFTIESGQLTSAKGNFVEEILSRREKDSKTDRHAKGYYSRSTSQHTSGNESSFKKLVNLCREEIVQGKFEKLVPSRSKSAALPAEFDLLTTFQSLCQLHPHAMVSVFSSPQTGTWVGATPELLVSVGKDQHFRTVAVAGTQPATGIDLRDVTWTQKDIEEQALVERYVISCFKKIRVREFEEHGPKTVMAGNVLHLKTDFDVDMVAINFPQLGSVMLELLHPTSAVCGMPREASLLFLRNQEGYDREFYSGYLGPLNVREESHLFVNLRCMQLFEDKVILYAGAGVLADSDPEKEWKETQMKMDTLEQIISK